MLNRYGYPSYDEVEVPANFLRTEHLTFGDELLVLVFLSVKVSLH